MSQLEEQPEGVSTTMPSMLDLIHLSRRPLFPPGGVDLYRQIALLTGIEEGHEVLDVACGPGGDITFQQARTDDLPFRDEIFDVSIGELGLTAGVEPEDE